MLPASPDPASCRLIGNNPRRRPQGAKQS